VIFVIVAFYLGLNYVAGRLLTPIAPPAPAMTAPMVTPQS
jgi:hypothetical protein